MWNLKSEIWNLKSEIPKSDSGKSTFEADGKRTPVGATTSLATISRATTSFATTFLDAAASLHIGCVARPRHLKLQI